MIKFFRKIRQNMIKENKVSKYLLYAIGEVLLVVIGILLAVQINSYQNHQRDRQIEQKVLVKLKFDLQKDTTNLNELLKTKKNQFMASQRTLDYFQNTGQTIKDTAQVINDIYFPFYDFVDNPDKTTFITATNSGNLFKITNDSLLALITSYYSDNNLTQYLLSTKSFTQNYFNDVLLLNYNRNDDIVKTNYFNDFQMENYYTTMILRLDIGFGLIKEKIANAESLINLIENKINRENQ